MTAVDWSTDLDIDLDATVPCGYDGCDVEATMLVILQCDGCECRPSATFCSEHTARIREAFTTIEQAYRVPVIGPLLVTGAPACVLHNNLALWKEAIPL